MNTKNWTVKITSANTDYIAVDSALEVCALSMIFFNSNASTVGVIKVRILNDALVEQAKVLEIEIPAKDSIMLDTKLFLNPNDQLIINSTITGIDYIVSGTEG